MLLEWGAGIAGFNCISTKTVTAFTAFAALLKIFTAFRGIKKPLKTQCFQGFDWRRRWDSNPRYLAVHLISSQARYDHFDTPPCNNYSIFKVYDHRIAHHFECRTFDLSDNSPCISTVFRALRKCKKNRQERYEILKFDPAKTLINQGFPAEKTAKANAHFESAPL